MSIVFWKEQFFFSVPLVRLPFHIFAFDFLLQCNREQLFEQRKEGRSRAWASVMPAEGGGACAVGQWAPAAVDVFTRTSVARDENARKRNQFVVTRRKTSACVGADGPIERISFLRDLFFADS